MFFVNILLFTRSVVLCIEKFFFHLSYQRFLVIKRYLLLLFLSRNDTLITSFSIRCVVSYF